MPTRPTVTDVRDWAGELDAVGERLARRFARSEPRRRAVEHLRGLLPDARRKNGRQLAEKAGDAAPTASGTCRRADRDADRVRDDLLAYAHGHPADPRGVLIVDQTGSLKKGAKSAGVQRQYSGTAGRVEGCRVGAFLAFAGRRGHALLDRELYPPEGRAGDARRREERAYYLCRGPAAAPRREPVRVAGSRWAEEECFARAEGACGLADYEVRGRVGWHRHVALSLFALAVLTVIRSRAAPRPAPRQRGLRG